MKYLITGSGFLAKHLIKELLKKKKQIKSLFSQELKKNNGKLKNILIILN